jgi:uncharacterized protein (DUF1800 family)
MAVRDNELAASIAVTRFGLGARPGEIAEVRADPKGWLRAQIRREGADQPQGAAPFPSIAEGLARIDAANQELMKPADPALRKQMLQPVKLEIVDEALARARLGASTPAGFRERWALFWTNHFTVSAKNVRMDTAVGPFDRDAIRPNVFARFQDLLLASTRHPGMLLYLDQAQSLGPDSPAALRQGKGGLNENLAREVLELHTVGADAGYTQADVTEFARALTGWTMGGLKAAAPEQRGVYLYRAAMHEPGPRTIMGRRYEGEGEDQAGAILVSLANDARTSRRISKKLAAHFVADDPPPALVARLDTAWRRSGGDLAEVAQALIAAPEAWSPQARKFKTPCEFIVSSYRAAGAEPQDGMREIAQPLTALGQRPFSPPQPNGWSDQAADWAAPDAIVKRLAWAQAFARTYAPQDADPARLAEGALGARLTEPVRQAVARAESRPEALAILLMSPEFQRR